LAIYDKNLRCGAVLKQPQENNAEKPVAYFSKKLNDSQKKETRLCIQNV